MKDLNNVEIILDVTKNQKQFWTEWVLDPKDLSYNNYFIFELSGLLSKDALFKSLNKFINNHEATKTYFGEGVNGVKQFILKNAQLHVEEITAINKAKADLLIKKSTNYLFDLSKYPLYHFTLIELNKREYFLVLNFHHIISDAFSGYSLIKQISHDYNTIVKKGLNLTSYEEKETSKPTIKDYITYDKKYLNSSLAEDCLYWKEELKETPLHLKLPGIQRQNTNNGKFEYFELDKAFEKKIKSFCKSYRTSPFIIIATIYSVVLKNFFSQEKILISYPVNIRPAGMKSLIGCFINNLPLVIGIDVNKPFLELIEEVTQRRRKSKKHQFCPTLEIIKNLGNNLNDKIFNVALAETHLKNIPLDLDGIKTKFIREKENSINVDICLEYEINNSIYFRVNYNSACFSEWLIKTFIKNFIFSAEKLLEAPQVKLASIGELPQLELNCLEKQTKVSKLNSISINELFEKQVRINPNAVCIKHVNQQITYRELNNAIGSFTNYLIQNRIKKGDRVIVSTDDTVNFTVAIFGLLKIGAIFIPIDPSLPALRKKNILLDIKPKAVLLDDNTKNTIYSNIDSLFFCHNYSFNDVDVDIKNIRQKLTESAAIFYTSGSTGKPKGIIINQRGIINYLRSVKGKYKISKNDIGYHFSSISFDASLEEVLLPILYGAKLISRNVKNNEDFSLFSRLCSDEKITYLTLATSYWASLIDYLAITGQKLPSKIRLINISGEKTKPTDVKRWYNLENSTNIELFNVYGTTETTIASCIYKICKNDFQRRQNIPIGKPIDNVSVYILDRNRIPVVRGGIGEIFISGIGVGNGYWNNQQLTQKHFFFNSFSEDKPQPIYKTGDIGRYVDNENLEFIGRNDKQIKINGIRVEIYEVESVASSHPLVRNATAILNDKDVENKSLVLCYIARKEVDILDYKRYMAKFLPSYMIPSVFIRVKNFPLNTSQKIDRQKLLEMAVRYNRTVPKHIKKPSSEIEIKLKKIWEEILLIKEVGVNEKFLEIGGNSLKAIQIVSRIKNTFLKEISVKEIFNLETIEHIALYIGQAKSFVSSLPVITKAAKTKSQKYLSSYSQKRLWFLDQYNPNNISYNVIDSVRLFGKLRLRVFEKSLSLLLERHEILKSIFLFNGDELNQKILSTDINFFRLFDLTVQNKTKKSSMQLAALLKNISNHTFDLAKGPLFICNLIKMREEEYILILAFHHIIIDEWSLKLLRKELSCIYNSLCAEKEPLLPSSKFQYRDFSNWQKNFLNSNEAKKQLKYWKNYLSGNLPLLKLPTDFPRPQNQSNTGDIYPFVVDRKLLKKLETFARNKNISLYVLLLSAYQLLLHRYTREKELLVGIPVANRTFPELEPMIGFFVNTLIVRSKISSETTVERFINTTDSDLHGCLENQMIPLEKIMEVLDTERSGSHNTLFQTMFTYQNMQDEKYLFKDTNTEEYFVGHKTARFDILLAAWNNDHGNLQLAFEYRTDLFSLEFIKQLSFHYKNILSSIINNHELNVFNLPILTPKEEGYLIKEYNNVKSFFNYEYTFCHYFDLQCIKAPNSNAITCESKSINYADLYSFSNIIANFLLKNLSDGEDKIALWMDRSIDYVICMIGVLKSGKAFIPIDPNYPEERINKILSQSKTSLILTQRKYKNIDIGYSTHKYSIEYILNEYKIFNEAPKKKISPNDLAYIIFTSGSTGLPKGAMIEHAGMINHLFNKINDLNITSADVVAEIAVQTFDVSIWQFLSALLVGGKTHILTGDAAWEPKQLLKETIREKITILETVPSHMTILLDEIELNFQKYQSIKLKWFISNAEILTADLCRRWFKSCPSIPLLNAYGPTECSDDTNHYKIIKAPDNKYGIMPIGKPLQNITEYILDEHLHLVPAGVIGDLYIGGIAVGRGYLNDSIKTNASFVPDKFNPSGHNKLYKTGDLAKLRLTDNTIEILGRSDFQVKIRGQRVEIGEIESVIRSNDNIKECLVVGYETAGSVVLTAYFTTKENVIISPEAVKQLCLKQLPDYMIPSFYIQMDQFPLNNNGKINRNELPLPKFSDKETKNNNMPITALEKHIAEIWEKILDIKDFNIKASFFQLGGHSLSAAEVVMKIRKNFSIDVPLRSFFENNTIFQFAKYLSENYDIETNNINHNNLPIPIYPKSDRAKLAPCQIPEWYAFQLAPDSPVYNISICGIFFKGKLKLDTFVKSLNKIILRHKVFNVAIRLDNNSPIQILRKPRCFDAKNILLQRTNIPEEKIMLEANRLADYYGNKPFDLTYGYPFRIKLVKYRDDFYQFLFVVHHIIWDETSTINMFSELNEIYNALEENKLPRLHDLSHNYFDYSQWINEAIENKKLEKQRQYWLEIYKNMPPVLDLPTDYPRPPIITFKGDVCDLWFSESLKQNLAQYLIKNNITLFSFMLAIIYLYLYRITGQKDIVIGSPVAGRSAEVFKPLLGLFATPIPIRYKIDETKEFDLFLEQIAAASVDALDNYEYPCNKVIEELNHANDLSRPKLFSVMYGVQNNKTKLMHSFKLKNVETIIKDVSATETKSARFDLTFVVDELNNDIIFSCIFNSDLFKKSTIERMLASMLLLCEQVLSNSKKMICQYDLLNAEEKKKLFYKFNATSFTDNKTTLCEKLDQAVGTYSNNIAISYNTEDMSYEIFGCRINQLANYINSKELPASSNIAICLPPAPHLIISIFATVKLGCCYIPMGVDYPQSRINTIIKDAKINFIIVDDSTKHLIPCDFEGTVINYTAEKSLIYANSTTLIFKPQRKALLSYILYTSGSTGVPKGVCIKEEGLLNLLQFTQRKYNLTINDKILFTTPITFDASILEVFWPLLYGATVVIPSYNFKSNPVEIINILNKAKITIFQSSPAILNAVLENIINSKISYPSLLRLVIVGGSALTREVRDKFYAIFKCRLMNHYGPTEVTVDATTFDCSNDFIGNIVPIGYPISNVKVFILDDNEEPVPVGVKGNIYVSSPGLATKYLNAPTLTEKAFKNININGYNVPLRLYKTGDTGKYSEDGCIYYIGRKDNQVKVLGNRIELEEVSSVINRHHNIQNSYVKLLNRTNSRKNLADGKILAYISLKNDVNTFFSGGKKYYIFSVMQKPELIERIESHHSKSWAPYFQGSKILLKYWKKIYSRYPQYQYCIVSEDEKIAAFGNSIPAYWNGKIDSLFDGWDDAVKYSFNSKIEKNNTVVVLAGVVAPEFRGQQLSRKILEAFKLIAKNNNHDRLIVPVRPTNKRESKDDSFENWCLQRRKDGFLKDNWLRTHEKIGGIVLKVSLHSQKIGGSIREWKAWSKVHFNVSGAYDNVPDTLQKVNVYLENDNAVYYDPCVWIEHPLSLKNELYWEHVDKNSLKRHINKYLPSYMIPNEFVYLNKIPLTETDKVNEALLPVPDIGKNNIKEMPKNKLQKEIARIWRQFLKLKKIGINEDFFELGGRSLSAIQMLSEIYSKYNKKIPLYNFYKNPCIKEIEKLMNCKAK